ncbi:MAG: DNA primase [Ignavibacteria bacterium]|nr:DNA primase [Ignavibacteria bacterium]
MRIPEDKLEEIRAAADIVDIVGGFVRLKKTGRFFTGLCPFYVEKTPSFHVNPDRNIYKCFGCGRGGNVFTFLMEMERVSFVDAVVELAEKYSIPVSPEASAPKPGSENLDALYEANRLAARFFHDVLKSPRGAKGDEYYQRRKWSDATIRRFGLGYAPDSWDELLLHARAAGVGDDILEQTGLVVRRDAGKIYDRFRGRVVFPIFSVTKKVIGFGARTLQPDEQPKYLNSPETPIYVKSRALYGLSHAVQAMRTADAVVIVEGYADVISLSQAGIQNVVATSGTALTPDQVRILTRYTKNFFFLYDADSAGFAAMTRGIDLMLEQDCDPRIVTLPAGEDPDSFVIKSGAESVRARMTSAVSFVDFITSRYQQEGKLDSPEGKTEAIRHIVGMLAKMEDRIRRELYVHHLAEKYRIYESVLYEELDRLLKRRKPARSQAVVQAPVSEAPEADDDTRRELPKRERQFLEDLIQSDQETQREVFRSVYIDAFSDTRTRTLLHLLFDQAEHEGAIDIDAIAVHIGDNVAMHQALADVLFTSIENSPGWTDTQTVNAPDHRQAMFEAYQGLLKNRVEAHRAEVMAQLRLYPDKSPLVVMKKQLDDRITSIGRATDFSALATLEPFGTSDDALL